jgi:hypothetical protein
MTARKRPKKSNSIPNVEKSKQEAQETQNDTSATIFHSNH